MDNDLIEKAAEFAKRKHSGQTRKSGSPYFDHPRRVAENVLRFKQSHKIDELIAAAYLHDTLEDTDTTIPELKENFGSPVALLVVELTNDKFASEAIGKARYLSEKLSNEKTIDSWALVIKLADRLDNISDFKGCSDEFIDRYKFETEEILGAIEKNRALSGTHRALIREIRKKLEAQDDSHN